MTPGAPAGSERRKAPRRPVLDSFSLFASIPKKGPHRLKVHDLSDLGIRFDLDTEGESHDAFPLKNGETLEIHLYLNQSLHIPLMVQIMRIESGGDVRRVGAEFSDKKDKAYKAFLSFMRMLDSVTEVAQFS